MEYRQAFGVRGWMTSCYCSSTCSSASAKKLLQHFERTSETALKAAARRWSTSSLQLSSNPKSCTRLLYTHFYYRRRRVENVSHMWASSTPHSGGNDRFCARLKTDISASNSGLRGRTRSCLTFLERGRRDESKMVRHDLR
jgi:hypothetical protein